MESSASAGRVASAVLDPRRWWAPALLCGAFFIVLLDGTITIVRLPSIGAGLHFSGQGLQWVLSAYALSFGGLLLLGGRAADLLGRRRVFTAGAVIFTAASLLCGLAWSPAALLAARVVQGAGAAIMTPTALSIISATFTEGSERNKALGIWGALDGIGATTAWLIGGPLVDGPGWRWIFFINIAVGLAALALSPVLLRDSWAALTRRSYDPAGALTITGALVLLVYAVVGAPGAGWGDVRTILPLGGSAVLVAAFALIESRHPRAAGAAAHLPLPDPGRRGRPDDPDRRRRGRHAVRPDPLRPAGARLLGPQVRHQLGRARGRGHGRRDRRPGRGRQPASARPPRPAWRSWPRGRSCSRRSPYTAATSRTSSSGCSCAAWGSAWPS
jgi:Major Facilitator Superfamily